MAFELFLPSSKPESPSFEKPRQHCSWRTGNRDGNVGVHPLSGVPRDDNFRSWPKGQSDAMPRQASKDSHASWLRQPMRGERRPGGGISHPLRIPSLNGAGLGTSQKLLLQMHLPKFSVQRMGKGGIRIRSDGV